MRRCWRRQLFYFTRLNSLKSWLKTTFYHFYCAFSNMCLLDSLELCTSYLRLMCSEQNNDCWMKVFLFVWAKFLQDFSCRKIRSFFHWGFARWLRTWRFFWFFERFESIVRYLSTLIPGQLHQWTGIQLFWANFGPYVQRVHEFFQLFQQRR